RYRVGLSPTCDHVRDRVLPALADADVKALTDQAHVGAHDAAQQDVADAVVDGILVRYPTFLHQAALHAELGRNGRDHAGVIGLHAADRYQRVGVGSDRVRDDVFELAQLVATEGEPRIAVLALGIDLHSSAEMAGEPLQFLDVGRPKCERIACKFFQHADVPDGCSSAGRATTNVAEDAL